MITLTMNGLPAMVEEGSHPARSRALSGHRNSHPVPHGWPFALRRLPPVRGRDRRRRRARLVSSCTYPAEDGLKVRTGSSRVMRARRMVLELLLASCPQSKMIQDLASAHGVRTQRFRQEHEDCILCGLLRADVRGADDGRGHRLPRTRRAAQHRHALRRASRRCAACAAAACTSAPPASFAALTTSRTRPSAAAAPTCPRRASRSNSSTT